MLCGRWRNRSHGCGFCGPPRSTLRGRGLKPLQGASVKSWGAERCSKRQEYFCQVFTTKMSESEPSDDASKRLNVDIRTWVAQLPGDESGGVSRSWPGGVRRIGGMSVVWAFTWNSGTSRAVALSHVCGSGTGVHQGRKTEVRVPDAVHWGGPGCSSVERAVMAWEQRPWATG